LVKYRIQYIIIRKKSQVREWLKKWKIENEKWKVLVDVRFDENQFIDTSSVTYW